MNDPVGHVRSNRERFRDELFDFLRIPSVSTESRYREEVARCADWVAGRMREAGMEGVETVSSDGHPIVLGEHRVGPEAPTLLVYGHYDVQPVDPEELWDSPPFEPSVRGGRVYARGATDNKGQIHMHLKALESCLMDGESLPVNVKLVIEGEEEIGSRHLETFLRERRDRLSCDAVLLSDTQMFSPELPSITAGLRGIVYVEVEFRGPASDLHSGVYGGPVVNPANALARTIAGLHDERGRVTVPGFYDDVRPIRDRDRAELAKLPFDPEEFRVSVGAPALGGEEGFGPLELIGYRPTLDVNGIWSGFTGEGPKTVLPAKATAKISMRLVTDQDPVKIGEALEERVRELAPGGVEAEIRPFQSALPWAADPEGPLIQAAAEALEEAFGHPAVFIREGGSIPIVPLLAETFGVPVLPVGFALPGCNLHAPNEWMDLEVYHTGIEALARLYSRAGVLGE